MIEWLKFVILGPEDGEHMPLVYAINAWDGRSAVRLSRRERWVLKWLIGEAERAGLSYKAMSAMRRYYFAGTNPAS